ncbi:MAG: UbiD family decarboxylase [Hyphomicrobiaceae bacterium]
MPNEFTSPNDLAVPTGAPPADLHEHLAKLEAAGLLVRVDRAINKDTELQPLVRMQFLSDLPEDERKAFLFTNVIDAKGRRYDMPVLLGALAASPRIYAMGMGRAVSDIGAAWVNAIANPVPPMAVTEAPVQEVVLTGDALEKAGGVSLLPVPVSTPGFDAAPYLTATLCITKDSESGIQNMGMYRAALKAKDRIAVRMVARPGGAGGYLHWLKYRERGEKMPIAIALGGAPATVFTSPQKLSIDADELAVAGGLLGRPVEVVRCKTIDLVVPARAEIVIEGLIDTSVLEPEAPFGESNGYVALEAFNMPMQVTAITHRRTPIFNAIISQVTPSESSVIKKVAYEPLFLAHLQKTLAIKGVRKVVLHEPLTNLRPVVFVQYAYGTPRGEVWRGLQGASSFMPGVGKVVIAVSDDIDPSSVDAVLWSIAYRCRPLDDVHIVPNRGGGQGSQYSREGLDATMMIDATRKRPMAPLALPARAYMEGAQEIWKELGLPDVKLRAPWHGYTLGDWTETWERFAQRTVAGDWELNGEETFKRQRGGLEPETSVKVVEKGL